MTSLLGGRGARADSDCGAVIAPPLSRGCSEPAGLVTRRILVADPSRPMRVDAPELGTTPANGLASATGFVRVGFVERAVLVRQTNEQRRRFEAVPVCRLEGS